MAKRISLEQWIREACEDTSKGKPCSAIALSHMKANGVGSEEVFTKELSGPQNFAQLGQTFTNKAIYHCQDMAGLQTFKLLAFYGEQEPKATHTFTIFEGDLTAGNQTPWSKHEPTPQGLLAQLMKHNEVLLNDNRQLSQGIIGVLMTSFVEHNKEKAEMHTILRDVLLNMRREEQGMAMERLKFQRDSEERAMLGRALPGFMNYLTGREIVPDSYVDSQIVESFAMKIGPQDLQTMVAMGKLTQEEAIVLAQRFTKIREEMQKRQALIKAAPPEDSNGKPAEPTS